MDNSTLAKRLVDRPDLIEQMIETLNYYSSGDFYYWDGCHCHGHYEFEKGDRAEECLYDIRTSLWQEDDI